METNGALPCIDLNALVDPIAQVDIDGIKYDVLPVQGEAMQIFEQIAVEQRARLDAGKQPEEEDPSARVAQAERYLDRARRIVRCVAPGIPKQRVWTMTVKQLARIAELAMEPVRAVQEVRRSAEGKGGGPGRSRSRTRSGRK